MGPKEPFELARRIFADPIVSDFLIRSSRLTVFSKELAKLFRSDLDLLAVAKQLKFFYNQPTVGVLQQLAILAARSVKRSVFVDRHCIFTSIHSRTWAVIFVAPSAWFRERPQTAMDTRVAKILPTQCCCRKYA